MTIHENLLEPFCHKTLYSTHTIFLFRHAVDVVVAVEILVPPEFRREENDGEEGI